MQKRILICGVLFLFAVGCFDTVDAQVVVSFSYQGKLDDGGSPANGQYDFLFKLYEGPTGGPQIGSDWVRDNVPVTNGIFTTYISFGTQPFTSMTGFFIETSVRPGASTGAYTPLSPRTPIQTSPYALKSFDSITALNAESLGGIPANQYVLTGDTRLTDARNPLPNSPNYIQNGTGQQPSSNFNISGDGTSGGTLKGNMVEATTQFNIAGERILSNAGSENLFAGVGAGVNNTIGIENSFFGRFAGNANSSGSGNSFFGFIAGRLNTTGVNNSYFGSRTGFNGTDGDFNSFFGHRAGENNDGSVNSFFGTGAGLFNNSGNSNTFIGHDAGNTNSSGSFNTTLGENSDVSTAGLTNATAVGSKALVSQSNSLVLGSINGVNGATADTNIGIGTTAPSSTLHVSGPGIVRARINAPSNGGVGLALGEQSLWSLAAVSPGHFNIFNDRIGQLAAWISTFDNSLNVGALNVTGIATMTSLGNAGATSLCRNASNQISICSSSVRYKSNISRFTPGLDLVRKLRPVSFNWRDGGMLDLGLIAEEVSAAEPLLTTTNANGVIEGVKYDRVGVVLLNAVKEQQVQIELQGETIRRQQQQIDALVKFACAANAQAEICRNP